MSRKAPILATDNFFLGEDKTLEYTVYDSASTEAEILAGTATPEDITGWTLEFVLRRRAASVHVTLSKTTADDIVITNGPLGQVSVVFHAADTADLTDGVYFYTLRRDDPGFHNDLAYGDFVLQIGATR